MFAVVEILGQQFKVHKDQKLIVNKLDEKEGSEVFFENVLLIDNGKEFSLGTPTIDGYSVKAKIIKHLRGDKVIVFKKKRRKGYRVKNGHKQHLSEILIESISNIKTVKNKNLKKATPSESNSRKLNTKENALRKLVPNKNHFLSFYNINVDKEVIDEISYDEIKMSSNDEIIQEYFMHLLGGFKEHLRVLVVEVMVQTFGKVKIMVRVGEKLVQTLDFLKVYLV